MCSYFVFMYEGDNAKRVEMSGAFLSVSVTKWQGIREWSQHNHPSNRSRVDRMIEVENVLADRYTAVLIDVGTIRIFTV